jgi:rhodanese-related sulfurtransferase
VRGSRRSIISAALAFGFGQVAASDIPMSGICTAETGPDAPKEIRTAAAADAALGERAAAADCRVRAAALIAGSAPRVLVDVRSAKDFAVASIPGSLNLGLGSLASHLAVKTASGVVLVGDGKNTPRLLRQCALLRERGLAHVEVLDGGLPAWHRAGGALAGDASGLDGPLLLSDRELHELLRQPDALLVLTQGRATPALVATGARIIQANTGAGDPREVLSRLPSAIARKTAAVILLPEGKDAAIWRKAARRLGLSDPLFFRGEASRYDAYVDQQARIAEAARQSFSGACSQG